MPIQVEVWGDYACFTRPEMKTERVSYDVMTPSAARGLLDSLYWHPGLRWVIDRIHVCAPIRFTNIRRNEVKDVISARRAKTVMEKGQGELYLAASESIQQRAATASARSGQPAACLQSRARAARKSRTSTDHPRQTTSKPRFSPWALIQARRFYISVWRCRKRGRITATSRGRKTGDIRRNTSRA